MLRNASVPWGANHLWNSTAKVLRPKKESANLSRWQQLQNRGVAGGGLGIFSGLWFVWPRCFNTFFLLSPYSSVLYKMGQICPWPKSTELNEVTFGTLKILDKRSACSLRLSNPQSKAYFLVHFSFLEEKCVILWLNFWALIVLQHHNLISLWTKWQWEVVDDIWVVIYRRKK